MNHENYSRAIDRLSCFGAPFAIYLCVGVKAAYFFIACLAAYGIKRLENSR